jgi:osmotically-inducible protein OsmY
MTDDGSALARVQASLSSDARINLQAHPLKVSIDDDAVVLEGQVDSVAAKKLALEHAASVEGIRGVVDRLRVDPGQPRDDRAIRDGLIAGIDAEREFANCTIRYLASSGVETFREASGDRSGDIVIAVDDGIVSLEGTVISLSHKRVLGVLAWWTPGRRDVVNSLRIEPGEEDNDEEVVEALRIVLEMDPTLDADQITAHSRDFVVTLQGYVATAQQRRRAELDAWSLFGVDDVINRIEVQV